MSAREALAGCSEESIRAVEGIERLIFARPRFDYDATYQDAAFWLRQIEVARGFNQPTRARHAAVMLCRYTRAISRSGMRA